MFGRNVEVDLGPEEEEDAVSQSVGLSRNRCRSIAGAFTTLLTVAGLALVAVPAHAQILYGSITGVVKDSQGATVPGATVTAVNKETNLTRDTVTNAEGVYTLTNVLPGPYDVKISLPGFKEAVRTAVPVTISQISRVDMTLEIGALTESITVASEAQLLQTDKADVHTELKSGEITSMPLNRFRNYQALMSLVPGTTPMAFGNAETDTPARSLATNVNGQVNTNNTTRTDGATNMNIWLPNHNMYISPAETVDTVNVSTSSFDAEQGNAGGAAVTVVTKSGTNQFHGSGVRVLQQRRPERDAEGSSAPATSRRSCRSPPTPTAAPSAARSRRTRCSSSDRSRDSGATRACSRSSPCRTPSCVRATSARRSTRTARSSRFTIPTTGTGNGFNRTQFPNNQIPSNMISPIAVKVHEPVPVAEQPRHRRRRVHEQLQASGRPHVRPRQLGHQSQLEPHVGASDLGQVQLHERHGR